MKKNTIRAIIVAALLLAIYNLIAFLIPFGKNPVFWVSYGFTLGAFIIVGLSVYFAFMKDPNAKSRFYGFPIARIGVIYGAVQLVASLAVMALSRWIPWWVATVVYAIAFGVAVIGLVAAEAVVDEIQIQDVKLKKDVSLMRALQSQVSQMATGSDSNALRALAEEFRYSDPVSSENTEVAEAALEIAVRDLRTAYVDGNEEEVAKHCRNVSALLADRNRLCKLNKV